MARLGHGARLVGLVAVAVGLGGAGRSEPAGGRLEGVVQVTRDGKPVSDPGPVVVYLVGFDEPAPKRTMTILQKDKTFIPDLLPITVGQEVAFPNGDPFFHNVFSVSPARRFDLGQYKKGSKKKSFPTVGVVDVYCNIHPDMAATILVLPNRRFATAGKDGSFTIDGIKPGTWQAYAYSRKAVKPVATTVEIASGKTTTVRFSLDENKKTFDHPNKYGETYRDPEKYR